MAFPSTREWKLAPILRSLVGWAEAKILAARLGMSLSQCYRIFHGTAPLPAECLAPLVRALGPERGDVLLHAVLGELLDVRVTAAPTDGHAADDFAAATELDARVAALEQGIAGGRPLAELRRLYLRAAGFLGAWYGAIEARLNANARQGRRAAA